MVWQVSLRVCAGGPLPAGALPPAGHPPGRRTIHRVGGARLSRRWRRPTYDRSNPAAERLGCCQWQTNRRWHALSRGRPTQWASHSRGRPAAERRREQDPPLASGPAVPRGCHRTASARTAWLILPGGHPTPGWMSTERHTRGRATASAVAKLTRHPPPPRWLHASSDTRGGGRPA